MLSGREPMAGDGIELGEESDDGRGESNGRVGGGLLSRRKRRVQREMNSCARQGHGNSVSVFIDVCAVGEGY